MSIILPKGMMRSLPPPVSEEVAREALTPEPEINPERPLTPHLSFSQLAMFLRCPAQYRFRYGLGLKDKPKVSMSLGKGGHAALEFNAKRKIATGSDAPEEEVVQKASDMMDFYLTEMPASEYEKDVEPGQIKDKFIAATRVYRRRDAPGIVPIAAEMNFDVDFNEFQHPDAEPLPEPIRIVTGKIDLLYDDVGTKIVVADDIARLGIEDFKYTAKRKNVEEVNLSPQLTTYAAVIRKLTNKWPTKLGFRLMLPGSKSDGPNSEILLREPQHMTPDALTRRMARLTYQYRQAEIGIRAGYAAPTDNPINCSWCGYRERCQKSLVDDIEAATIRAHTSSPQD